MQCMFLAHELYILCNVYKVKRTLRNPAGVLPVLPLRYNHIYFVLQVATISRV